MYLTDSQDRAASRGTRVEPTLKIRTRAALAAAVSLGLLLSSGCARVISGPKTDDAERVRPDQIANFDTLYNRNCAACHGAEGKNGPAIPMNNPEYMALVSDEQLRNITANGQKGTLMPAFGKAAGGLLTDQQINVIVAGMRQRWAKPMPGLNPPPYEAHTTGDVAHGEQVYTAACASCHGPANQQPAITQGAASAQGETSAQGGGAQASMAQPGNTASAGKAGSITDPTFLALLSDQSLRTITVAGRPDLGQPDWRGDIPGHALGDQEITDVVAWLSSHRAPQPGQTHPDPGVSKPAATEMQRRVQ